jgi:hypothetical protein
LEALGDLGGEGIESGKEGAALGLKEGAGEGGGGGLEARGE